MLYLYDTLLEQSETDPERDIIGPFMVKPCKETYPDYYRFIKNPMDMETIKKRIKSSSYKTFKKFKSDVTLMFENCKAYNDPTSILHQDACELQKIFNKVRNAIIFSSAMSKARASRDLNQLFCFVKLGCLSAFWFVCQNFGLFSTHLKT